eukprot:4082933-Pleurochrysis_carterae.AAC.1
MSVSFVQAGYPKPEAIGAVLGKAVHACSTDKVSWDAERAVRQGWRGSTGGGRGVRARAHPQKTKERYLNQASHSGMRSTPT